MYAVIFDHEFGFQSIPTFFQVQHEILCIITWYDCLESDHQAALISPYFRYEQFEQFEQLCWTVTEQVDESLLAATSMPPAFAFIAKSILI